MSARPPGSLSFRTVYGGPAIPLDVLSKPTALLRPRVLLAKRRASGELRLNSDDVLRTTDPAARLRPAVHDVLDELVTRVARRVPGFDAESERARFAFLRSSAVEGTPS